MARRGRPNFGALAVAARHGWLRLRRAGARRG
jgi:hypothetical protein